MASGSRARVGRAVLFVVGLLARVVGAGVLFWLVFPLWLGIFWSVQGYPPTLGDLARWYALGAFNAAPIVATVGVSILLTPLLTIRLSSILPPWYITTSASAWRGSPPSTTGVGASDPLGHQARQEPTPDAHTNHSPNPCKGNTPETPGRCKHWARFAIQLYLIRRN